MATIETLGDKSPLKKAPSDMERSEFKGGKMEILGEQVPLKQTVTPMEQFDKGIAGGTIQQFGSTVPLNRSARRGWDSHPTPVSKNDPPG